MSTSLHPLVTAVSAVLEAASERLNVPATSIDIELIEAHEWPDACLGVLHDGEVCAGVVTAGYRIRLADGLTYHADQHGAVREARTRDAPQDTEIRLRYSMMGGIAGRSTKFETDSTRLTDAEESELRRLVTEAEFFSVATLEPTTVVMDGYTTRLWIAVGRRSHEVVRSDGMEIDDTEAFHVLLKWAADRTPPLFPRLEPDPA